MNDPDPDGPRGSGGSAIDPWAATQAQTVIATQVMAYEQPAAEQQDIGQLAGVNRRELFVSCEAALALQQQFDHLQPEFIAVHDMQAQLASRLLAGVAAAGSRAVQTLAIRRQGFGNTLATIEFVDLPTAGDKALRLYATNADADIASRPRIAHTLLAHSRLGVIVVGDIPAQALSTAFRPLQDAMIAGPWPNRHLLLLPLTAASSLATLGTALGRSAGIDVRTTPTVTRPAEAWNFITATWARLREHAVTPVQQPAPVQRVAVPSNYMQAYPADAAADAAADAESATGPAPARPLPLRPMPDTRARAPSQDPYARYVDKLSEIAGMVSCCVFEVATGRPLAHAGASPGADALAEHGADLIAAMMDTSRTLGIGHALPDAAITLGAHHLVLRAVPRRPGLALHAVLDKTHANITLARLQIARLDGSFDTP